MKPFQSIKKNFNDFKKKISFVKSSKPAKTLSGKDVKHHSTVVKKVEKEDDDNVFKLPDRRRWINSIPIQPFIKWKQVVGPNPGLDNLGNTCFMNATLQCLSSTPAFSQYLSTKDHSSKCTIPKEEFCVFCYIEKFFSTRLVGGMRGSVAPSQLAKNIRILGRQFRFGRQEDSHEFLRCLLNRMHLNALQVAGVEEGNKERLDETDALHHIFGGYFRNQVHCTRCGYDSNRFDAFMDLSLELGNGITSVQKALSHFCSKEILDESNQWKCDKCKVPVKAEKTLSIYRPPPVLTIHLKRFSFTPNIPPNASQRQVMQALMSATSGRKLRGHVVYPLELDISSALSDGGSECKYALHGVLVHEGSSANSGHYYAYTKAANDQWYCMNDSSVDRVSSNEALKQEAFVLFYSRVDLPNTKDVMESTRSPDIKQQIFEASSTSTSSSMESSESDHSPFNDDISRYTETTLKIDVDDDRNNMSQSMKLKGIPSNIFDLQDVTWGASGFGSKRDLMFVPTTESRPLPDSHFHKYRDNDSTSKGENGSNSSEQVAHEGRSDVASSDSDSGYTDSSDEEGAESSNSLDVVSSRKLNPWLNKTQSVQSTMTDESDLLSPESVSLSLDGTFDTQFKSPVVETRNSDGLDDPIESEHESSDESLEEEIIVRRKPKNQLFPVPSKKEPQPTSLKALLSVGSTGKDSDRIHVTPKSRISNGTHYTFQDAPEPSFLFNKSTEEPKVIVRHNSIEGIVESHKRRKGERKELRRLATLAKKKSLLSETSQTASEPLAEESVPSSDADAAEEATSSKEKEEVVKPVVSMSALKRKLNENMEKVSFSDKRKIEKSVDMSALSSVPLLSARIASVAGGWDDFEDDEGGDSSLGTSVTAEKANASSSALHTDASAYFASVEAKKKADDKEEREFQRKQGLKRRAEIYGDGPAMTEEEWNAHLDQGKQKKVKTAIDGENKNIGGGIGAAPTENRFQIAHDSGTLNKKKYTSDDETEGDNGRPHSHKPHHGHTHSHSHGKGSDKFSPKSHGNPHFSNRFNPGGNKFKTSGGQHRGRGTEPSDRPRSSSSHGPHRGSDGRSGEGRAHSESNRNFVKNKGPNGYIPRGPGGFHGGYKKN